MNLLKNYIFDDINICKALNLNHDLYLEQCEAFNLIIGYLIDNIYTNKFYIFKSDAVIPVNKNNKIISISINDNYDSIDDLFYKLARRVSQQIPCHYIQNFNESRYGTEIVNALLILKEFNNITYKILYNLYINLKKDYNNVFNIIKRRTKITKTPKWNCKKDCPCNCGLLSPLHSVIDEWRGIDRSNHKVREKNEIPKLVDIGNIVILFGGCHLLRNLKFFINDKQIHMGVLEFILPTLKSNESKIEEIFFSNDENFFEIMEDIKSLDIRSIRNDREFSSILSFSSKNSFIKLLQNRGKNYGSKINVVRDSQPFITSKYKSSQGKTNILQFIDHETFDDIFSYAPLRSLGFLERAIVSQDLALNTHYVINSLHKVAQFLSQEKNSVRINIDIDEFKKRFTYVYTPDTTIFTKDGLEKFYTTTAIKFTILFTIIDNIDLQIEEPIITISDTIIEKSSLMSLMLLAYRDKLLVRHTKKYKLKKSFKDYLKEYRYTFIYHRDIERKFSSYSKTTLNKVIDELIQESILIRLITHNINNKKIIVYRIPRSWE